MLILVMSCWITIWLEIVYEDQNTFENKRFADVISYALEVAKFLGFENPNSYHEALKQRLWWVETCNRWWITQEPKLAID